MESPDTNRRDLMKIAGLAGLASIAGCNAPSAERPPTQTPPQIDVDRIAADPTDVPPPVTWDEPREHEIAMETVELTAEVDSGKVFEYMTFDGQVPGPMVRVRRGDRIQFQLSNPDASEYPHNMDFHAVYGPGGGAEATTITPGQSAEIEFTAMYPGVHIYHCAVPNFDHHISAGMFGAILVEPEDGLPEVDRELYFGQHEIYTQDSEENTNHAAFDFDAMSREEPTYVVFNGKPYAFTDNEYGPIQVETDERIRIYFANGGPNLTSSWHAIGNVWSRLYRDGDLVSEPAQYVETTAVPPGSVAAAEIETPVPGPIRLVDHAASRLTKRGALGIIEVMGEERPDIFDGGEGGGDYGGGDDAQNDFDGWFEDVDNYTGVVDKTGENRSRVAVGTQGNGGFFAFEPAAIEVNAGTTVVWEWTGQGGAHNVVARDGPFESELTDDEAFTYEYTFSDEGEYRYVCTPHETLGMKGIVVVS